MFVEPTVPNEANAARDEATLPPTSPATPDLAVEYVAFDLETTGLSPKLDRIVEIGAIRFDGDGRELGLFQSLVNPGRPSSPGARAVHGIDDASLSVAETAERVIPRFLEFLGTPERTTLLAHNAAFDAGFLGSELTRLGRAWPEFKVVDTLHLARKVRPDLRSHRLEIMAGLYGISKQGMHRALGDSRRVMELFLALNRTGESDPGRDLLAYPFRDASEAPAVPVGWDDLSRAIEAGHAIRMIYAGGSRGSAPREITPRRFEHHGGSTYVVALCHLDRVEKSFRLDRVQTYEVVIRDRTVG